MGEIRITPQKILKSGIVPSFLTPLTLTDTYLVRNTGRMVLHFQKTEAVDANLVIETPLTVDGLTVQEQALEVLASTGDKIIGPFAPSIFNDGLGDVRFTISDNIAGLQVAAFEI